MYICKNCGLRYLTDEAVMCVRCHAPKGAGSQFCPCCGNAMPSAAPICMNCGVDTTEYGCLESGKSKTAAGILGIFFGYIGVHNFYLGKIKRGVIQMVGFIGGVLVSIGGTLYGELYQDGWRLAVGVISGLLGLILLLGVQIWGFIEGILILCGKMNRDGQGKCLKN